MVDLFEQVEEELRADQYKRMGARALPWIIGLVVGIVVVGGGYIAWTKYQESVASKASERFEAAQKVFASGDHDGAFKQFQEVVDKGPGAYKTLALMQQGSIRLDQGNAKAAVVLFDKAAKTAPGGASGDLLEDSARLKSALALLDDAPYAEIEGRLKPLAENDRPYHTLALEALAMAKLRAGKAKDARGDFLKLSSALDVAPGVADRARAAISMIDSGAAAAIPAAVKSAQALPPANAGIPPELLQQLQAQGVQVQGAPAQGAPAQGAPAQ